MRKICLGGWHAALVVTTLALGMSTGATASDYEIGESCTGFKFGLIGSGSVDYRDMGIRQRAGFSAGFFFDQPFSHRLQYSLSADLHKMTWRAGAEDFRWDETEWLLDLGVNLKGNLGGANSPIRLQPGLGAGLAILGKMATPGVAGSSYLTLRACNEFVFMSASDLMTVLEVGIWYAPSGGDSNSSLSIGPLWLLRLGVMF